MWRCRKSTLPGKKIAAVDIVIAIEVAVGNVVNRIKQAVRDAKNDLKVRLAKKALQLAEHELKRSQRR